MDAFLQLLSKRVGIVLKSLIQCHSALYVVSVLRVRFAQLYFFARDAASALIGAHHWCGLVYSTAITLAFWAQADKNELRYKQMLTILMFLFLWNFPNCREESRSRWVKACLCFHLSGMFGSQLILKPIVLLQDSGESCLVEWKLKELAHFQAEKNRNGIRRRTPETVGLAALKWEVYNWAYA